MDEFQLSRLPDKRVCPVQRLKAPDSLRRERAMAVIADMSRSGVAECGSYSFFIVFRNIYGKFFHRVRICRDEHFSVCQAESFGKQIVNTAVRYIKIRMSRIYGNIMLYTFLNQSSARLISGDLFKRPKNRRMVGDN